MIEQGLEKIREMAVAGVTPDIVNIDSNDLSTTFLYNPKTGEVESYACVAPSRRHKVSTLASLTGAFNRYSPAYRPSVWCSLSEVAVVLDDEQEIHGEDDAGDEGEVGDSAMRHRISLPILVSPIFDTLKRIPSEQKKLVMCLRHDLRPAQIEPPNFQETVSCLNFETNTTSQGDFGVVKSTLGSTKNSEVKAKNDIPPEITVTFVPFPALADEIAGEVQVECSVVIDPETKQIAVRPFPGQIEQAQAHAVEMLRARVGELLGVDETVVFAGTP